MGNVASACNALGRYQEAYWLGMAVLRRKRTLLGPDHLDTIVAMENLATSYGGIGKHEKACELQRQVLERRKTLLGEEHPDTLLATRNLLRRLMELKEVDEYGTLLQTAVRLHEIVLGGTNYKTRRLQDELAKLTGQCSGDSLPLVPPPEVPISRGPHLGSRKAQWAR